MKNRDYKQFAAEEYYHLYNRGNGQMEIFQDEQDFRFFLLRLKENLFPEMQRTVLWPEDRPLWGRYVRKALPGKAFSLLCYCLMPNHYHFLIKQNGDTPISLLLKKVCTTYAMYFNRKHGRVGALFQSKFRSVLVSTDSQLLWLSAYIHQNPKVARLAQNLLDYPWSSYPDYVGGRKGVLCDKGLILNQFRSPDDYREFVDKAFDPIKSRKTIEHLMLD